MSAAAEMLQSAWKQAGIEVLTVAHTPDNKLDTGYVRGHTPCMYTSCKLTAYEIYQLLYVNDGAFPFPTCAALIKGLTLCIATLHALASKYILDKTVTPPKLNAYSFPLPNSLMIFNSLLQR
jgi:hypothetical protein